MMCCIISPPGQMATFAQFSFRAVGVLFLLTHSNLTLKPINNEFTYILDISFTDTHLTMKWQQQ